MLYARCTCCPLARVSALAVANRVVSASALHIASSAALCSITSSIPDRDFTGP
jgi:hypothetical protein